MNFKMIFLTVFLIIYACLAAKDISFKNQFSVTMTDYLPKADENVDLYGLWQPQADIHKDLNKTYSLDMEGILSGSIREELRPGKDKFIDKGSVYRLWLKGSTKQSELRVGLQRLNFGSATMLRPLQWFDNLDPRDRLQLTDGVQAALVRYFFLNNTNFWIWGIRGEGKNRGLLPTVTKKGTPEFGGRFQYPLKTGDIGFTYNHRFSTYLDQMEIGYENDMAIDIRLDYAIGLWGEASLSQSEKGIPLLDVNPMDTAELQGAFTQGGDYTIGIGNGLYVLVENQVHVNSANNLENLHPDYWTIAFSSSYPLSIFDTLLYYSVIRYDGTNAVQTIIWRREYDKLSWDAGIFWDSGSRHNLYNSRGVKLLISYIF
jgi:hypothetical protein